MQVTANLNQRRSKTRMKFDVLQIRALFSNSLAKKTSLQLVFSHVIQLTFVKASSQGASKSREVNFKKCNEHMPL